MVSIRVQHRRISIPFQHTAYNMPHTGSKCRNYTSHSLDLNMGYRYVCNHKSRL